MKPERNDATNLADAVGRILDKGLVINADITVSLAGVELLGIKIRAALASFETAARYGLEFPSGTNLNTPVWREAIVDKITCPRCGESVERGALMNDRCPWCGWESAIAREHDQERRIGSPSSVNSWK